MSHALQTAGRGGSSQAPTNQNLAVLDFVADFIQRKGYSPALEDICAHFRWASKHSAHLHVSALERCRLIERVPRLSRTLRLTDRGLAVVAEAA